VSVSNGRGCVTAHGKIARGSVVPALVYYTSSERSEVLEPVGDILTLVDFANYAVNSA